MKKINNREYHLAIIFTLLQITHVLDFTVMIPLAPIFIRDFQLTAKEFSYLVSSYNLSSGLITIFIGNLIDYTERKKFLLFSYVGFIIATFFCAMSDSYIALLISRIMAGAFGGLTATATFAFLGDQVREEVRGEATGIVLSSFAITSVIGIPFSLYLATTFHWKFVFIFIVIISLMVLGISFKLLPRVTAAQHIPLSYLKVLINYYRIVKRYNEFLGLVLISLVSISSFLIIPFIAPYVVSNLHLPESDLKYAYLIGGIGALLSARFVGMLGDRYGHKKVYVICASISIIPGLAITHLSSSSTFLIFFIFSAFMVLFNSRFIPIMSYMNQISEKHYRGTYFAMAQSIRTLSIAFATWLAGIFVEVNPSGSVEGFSINGWMSAIIILFSFYIIKLIKR